MSDTSVKMNTPSNDIPVISSYVDNHTQREPDSLEKIEQIYNSFQYGFSKDFIHGLDERFADMKQNFNGGQEIAQQGEMGMKAYLDQSKKDVEAILDVSTLDNIKQALEKNAEDLHAAYTRGDYHEMGEMTGALVVAAIEPDKLKQLKRFTDVAGGVKHIDDVAAGAAKNIDNLADKTPEIPKAYAHDSESSKEHDPDLMRGRKTGPVTIGDTVYESGKEPRKLGPDEKPPLTLVEKEEMDATEVLKPRKNKPTQDAAPVKPENEHLVARAGIGIATLAGLAFGAIRYYEMQHTHRRELGDAYSAAVNMNDYADNPQDRLNRYTAAIQKHPELENAIKLFEGARVAAAKDGFTYQEVKALELVVANTKESIRNGDIAKIVVQNQDDIANRQPEIIM